MASDTLKLVHLNNNYDLKLHYGADVDSFYNDDKIGVINKLACLYLYTYAKSEVENPEEKIFYQNPKLAKKFGVKVNTIRKRNADLKRLGLIKEIRVDNKTKKKHTILDIDKCIEWTSTLPEDQVYKDDKRGSVFRRFVNCRVFSIISRIGGRVLESVRELKERKQAYNQYVKKQRSIKKFSYMAPLETVDHITDALDFIEINLGLKDVSIKSPPIEG